MSQNRFDKGKERLLLTEQVLQRERQMKKKLNRSTVPESSVRIPKIGEWSIGASEPVEPPPKVVSPLRMRVGMSPTKVSKRFTQALPQVPVEEPPFAIRPPKMNASDFIPSDRNLIFPPGTVTTDVTDILKSRFRAPRRPLPPLRGREEVEVEPQYLPLEMFDDATYQEYPLEELLQEPYAFSRYQDLDGTSYWAKCTVVEYDEKNEIFTIEWDGTRKRKQVARFNLRFEKEDPDLYEKRIAEAKKSCARYETMLRFEARVAEMPTAALPQLSKTNLDNFRTRMGLDVSKQYLVLLKGMENEVKKDFVTMNNRLDFLWDLRHNPMIPNREEFLLLFPDPKPAPENGLVPHPHYNFRELLEMIAENHLVAMSHFQVGLLKIWKIVQDSCGVTFLTAGFEETVELDQFVANEFSHLQETTKNFKGTIQTNLEKVIASTVAEPMAIMKPKDKIRYQNLILLTTRILESILIQIIDNTLETYLSLYVKYLPSNPVAHLLNPQFSLILEVDGEKKLNFSPTIEQFRHSLVALMASLEDVVYEVPIIKSPIAEIESPTMSFQDVAERVKAKKPELDDHLNELFKKLEEFLANYRYLEETLNLDTEEYCHEFDPKGSKTLDEYREVLTEFHRILEIVQNEMSTDYQLGIFHLSCEEFKQKSSELIRQLIFNFLSQVKQFALQSVSELKKEFEEIQTKLQKVPETPEDLAAQKKYLENVQETVNVRSQKMAVQNERFAFLEEFRFDCSNEEVELRYRTMQMPLKINAIMDETERTLSVERIRMIRELRSNQRKMENDILTVQDDVTAFIQKYTDLEASIEAYDVVQKLDQTLTNLKKQQEMYNRHEKLFDFEQVQSRGLAKVFEEFIPVRDLWVLAFEWARESDNWLQVMFPQIRADAMNQFITQNTKKLLKLKKDLAEQRVLIDNVLVPLTAQIDQFKKRMPMLTKLRHPGIKTKHWEAIAKIVGFEVRPSTLNMQQFLDLNLERWGPQITEIASVAVQEYSLESALDQMEADLQQKQMVTVQFRDTPHYVLHEVDDIISIIEDQLVTTQTLLTSPFIGPIKQRAQERLAFLRTSQKVLDSWINCQKNWLYLQPIFSGTSIQQKLHKEARDWGHVDKIWSQIMTLTHSHPEFNTVMHQNNLLEDLTKCNELLDSITHGLNAYLESKRLGFPRFFFLSNDELISILSHTKDFSRIQDSMQKLFEYVNSITVTDEMVITHMNDAEGETVKLKTDIDGDTPEIEDWLNAFEKEMRETLKYFTGAALEALPTKKKEDWIADFPAQVILTANQISWTQQVTSALEQQTLRGLKVLQSKFVQQLEGLTAMVRQPISKLVRQVVSCMLIFEVHNRDIISGLIADTVSDVENFKWVQQLRYYWEDNTVMVRSINNTYEYSYEYAGNSARLVITPLTDRCYQTLLSAFKQFLSGAPSGPAGTGKTETARDCAKALGRPCVVYNCSEEVTPEQMSQFFAGLSSSGAWSCFDEFNRINIEVLSVIAQQVRTIQTAIAANADTFQLDARTLKLNVNAAIIITMNPGYAGRTELPDNLKALFRPCAMMVPDFVFICEIMLFSGGFVTASNLAIKMVALFDLCRKQLSNAHHYDWGMRATKAILSTASKRKRNDLEADEAQLLVSSIRDCTAPRLVSVDLPLFEGIIHDVFPEVVDNKKDPEALIQKIKESLVELKEQPIPVLVGKCVEYYETTLVRHGIMLVGGPMGGKSSAWKALQKGLTKLAGEGDGQPVHVEHLNPKAISISELYGAFNPVTSEWADGVLSQAIRQCSFSEQTELKWIIVDGPVDSLWIESMNSLLDDNKVLCLPNNERIQLGPHVKMVFEVDDLSQASPATVSRCGMIYFDPSTIPWTALADSWTEKYAELDEALIKYIRELMNQYVPAVAQFIVVDGKTSMSVQPNFIMANFLRLLDCFMPMMRSPEKRQVDGGDEVVEVDPLDNRPYFSLFSNADGLTIPYVEGDAAQQMYEKVVMFCLVWAFGGALVGESRSTFDKFFRDLMEKNETRCPFPPKNTVFDYFSDFGKGIWAPWVDGSTNMALTIQLPLERQFVPTSESASAMFLTRILVSNGHHTLMQGPETSKTLIVKTLMDVVLDPNSFDCYNMPLANCSTPSGIGKFMITRMHRHQGSYGPLPNHKLVFFADNLGSVKPEIYGAQPPLELLRQFMDYGGWFNTASVEFMNIVSTIIVGAMGQPGGGLYDVPSRLAHHFFILHIPRYESATMLDILNGLYSQQLQHYHPAVKDMVRQVSAATMSVYNACVENLLPIPSKLHYVFSLRNLVRVLKGILLCAPDFCSGDTQFVRLWHHEMMREFYDRFNSDSDREWFFKQLNKSMEDEFKKTFDVIAPNGWLMYNEFADSSQKYKEVAVSKDQLLTSCTNTLEEHNRDATKPIDIVLFSEAIDHLSALSRIFSMKRGHALLVGVKSSGRRSLARLALHMASMDTFEIAITRTYGFAEWREDLKNLLKQCGQEDVPTGFILSDVQIIFPQQLEDLSNLLINGEISNLFEREEIDQIRAEMMQQENEAGDMFKLFMSRVKTNLHIILVFSPYGSAFKDAMLSYTALRTETTIDWYMPWSQNALESVATASLKKLGKMDKVAEIVSVCVNIHKSVEVFAARFLKETKRFTSVTPSRYFELLTTFNAKMIEKQTQTDELISKYENGVEKIVSTRAQIETMSEQLDRDIPVLQKTRKEVEEMLQDLNVKRGEVEQTRKEVQSKSEVAEKEAEEADEINKVAQEQLALAQPILKQAQDAVNKLDKNSLVEIKKLHQPTSGMKDTFDAICIMFGRNPKRVDGHAPGEKVDDYWPEAVSLLNDVKFITNIQTFDPAAIDQKTIAKLKKYVPTDKGQRSEKRKAALASFQSVAALYDWVCASYDYWFVYQEILPKKLAAEEAERKLEITKATLAEARAHLQQIEDKLKELEDSVATMQAKEQELAANVEKTQTRLMRAQKIMNGLSGETSRWSETATSLKATSKYILGDSLLIAGVLTYIGAFSPQFRHMMLEKWKSFLQEYSIIFTENFTIAQALGNEGMIRDWIVKGLPNDTHSIENALIITQGRDCFPLLIDPQLSGTKWLRAISGEQLKILSQDQGDFLQNLKSCVTFGLPVLITNVGLKLDQLLDPLLSREILNVDGQKRVALGGEYVPYSDGFRLYISTKYPNPHYSPEVCSQVTLINFTTTQDGLTDLLLNNLIEVEREELEQQRLAILEANAENTRKLREVEAEILQIVSNAGSDILDDDLAINTLARAQRTSADIAQQMEASKQTEIEISEFKGKFSVVAERAALLYFCVSDFSVIDPMYQFSLKWFVGLFRQALHRAEHPSDLKRMIESFHKSIAMTFYKSVSYSLFSRHKLLFSTLMAIRILTSEHKITGSELAFLLQPVVSHDPNPTKVLPDEVWQLVASLEIVSKDFAGLVDHIKQHEDLWEAYVNSQTPETDTVPYPPNLTPFQKLLMVRIFHLQRVREALHIFIEENLGTEFVTPPTLNLLNVFKDSDPISPLIFIIMPGIDPQDEIISVAQSMELDQYFRSYSLGRGRGQGAEELILDAADRGFWVLLQNCHLSLSWMPRLETLINNLDPTKVHERFRLCLVTMSSPDFPIGILYQGTKLIYEIPKGMRENVMRIYNGFNADEYNSEDVSTNEKQLTFHLAFFHSVVLERLQFGSIGWNIPYEFNPSDFYISRRHLKTFLAESGNEVPFEALSYVIGELNYGGRVTDRWDRRLLLSLLRRYFSEDINAPLFSFGARYKAPDYSDNLDGIMKTVSKWPVVTAGGDVGLAQNASTITARNEALGIFNSLIEVQPTLIAASETTSEEQFALNLVESLIKQVPKPFNVHNFLKRFNLEDTISTVLHHEILLYNELIRVMNSTLEQMRRGLKGLIIIDEQLELLNRRLLANKVPEVWLSKSFPSILPLRLYMEDLNQRVEFLNQWVTGEKPKVFRLGAFYHPEEFLTAILQVYARKHVVPFDSLAWKTTPLDVMTPESITQEPDEGIYIEGLPLEGAKWDVGQKTLIECGQKDLMNYLPLMHLMPTQDKKMYEGDSFYECPVFRTQNRGTGALDLPNYIISVYLPTSQETPDHWVQRSVAAFITIK